MKTNVYGTDGKIKSQIILPKVFEQTVRKDLIKRAVMSERSELYQPKGSDPRAGLRTSADYIGRKDDYHSGKNKGGAMLPKEKLPKGRLGKVRRVPFAVSGRRAHPPKPEKVLIEKINKKEYAKAMKSAVAATADVKFVTDRGHKVSNNIKLPIILDGDFDKLIKSKDLVNAIGSFVQDDLDRAVNGRKKVSSRNVRRKTPRSVLIVTDDKSGLLKSGKNVPGVDVTTVKGLKAELLAPGTHAGRLTLYTLNAIEELKNW